jgi:hypothetical protein
MSEVLKVKEWIKAQKDFEKKLITAMIKVGNEMNKEGRLSKANWVVYPPIDNTGQIYEC